jgi:hypothetical protein
MAKVIQFAGVRTRKGFWCWLARIIMRRKKVTVHWVLNGGKRFEQDMEIGVVYQARTKAKDIVFKDKAYEKGYELMVG